jgi:hypothetical protein
MTLAMGVPRDGQTSFAPLLFGKTISCGCIFSSGMRAWSRSFGSLRAIESGHCADSKTNVPRRTGESIQPKELCQSVDAPGVRGSRLSVQEILSDLRLLQKSPKVFSLHSTLNFIKVHLKQLCLNILGSF